MSIYTDERRKENRICIQFPATLCWREDSGEEITQKAFTLTVSNSGLSLMTKRAPAIGKRIKVTLDVEGLLGSSLAEVKWLQETIEWNTFGLRFISGTPGHPAVD
jgi:hypothetical protein